MSNKDIKAKIAEAQSKVATQHTVSNTIQVSNMWSWLNRTTKKDFKGEVISLNKTLKEKLQFLTFGKPIIVDNDSEEAAGIADRLELQEILFSGIGDAFNYGVTRVIIEPLGNNKVQLRLADPNFPNVVRKIGRIPYEAEYWTPFMFDRATYWKRTIVNEMFVYNDVYTSKDGNFDTKKRVNIKGLNKQLSDTLKIIGKEKNKYGFINVIEIPYVPTRDLSVNALQELAPANRINGLQLMLNEGTSALRLELFLNRTKMLVDQDLLDGVSKDLLTQIADENIIASVSDSGDADGKNKLVEIMQGDPKVDQYWTNITNIISLAVQSLKLSELGESDSTTATDAIFNKGNDVETINALSTFYQRKIAEILEKAYAMEQGKSFNEVDLDITGWGVQIVPNVIMNEAKLTDIVIAQLGAGLINMTTAKVKLENISKESAKNALQDPEEFLNPSLNAMTGFGNEDEETPTGESADQETGNPQPEGTGGNK